MSDYKKRIIKLNSLLLDLENPRHDILTNQVEAYKVMIKSQGRKIINLAKDILYDGLNPSEIPIVIPYNKSSSKYIVLEGNRRLAAIQILKNQKIADLIEDKILSKKIKELSSSLNQNLFNELECIIFKEREDALKWISLRHTGDNDGVGTVSWTAKEKRRFEQRTGKKSIVIDMLDFLRTNTDNSVYESYAKIPITNLERLLGDPDIRSLVGLDYVKGELLRQYPTDEILKPMRKIFNDFTEKDSKVRIIYSKQDRNNYQKSFGKNNLPNPEFKFQEAVPLLQQDNFSGPPIQKRIRKKGRKITIDRKTLIPGNFVVDIKTTKINEIFWELKGLEVDQFRYAVSVMFRVFLELSVDDFIEKKNIMLQKSNPSLSFKINQIADYFKNNNILNHDKLKPVNICTSNPNSILSTNTLNAYVHNRDLHPVSSELKIHWDNLQNFVEKLWE